MSGSQPHWSSVTYDTGATSGDSNLPIYSASFSVLTVSFSSLFPLLFRFSVFLSFFFSILIALGAHSFTATSTARFGAIHNCWNGRNSSDEERVVAFLSLFPLFALLPFFLSISLYLIFINHQFEGAGLLPLVRAIENTTQFGALCGGHSELRCSFLQPAVYLSLSIVISVLQLLINSFPTRYYSIRNYRYSPSFLLPILYRVPYVIKLPLWLLLQRDGKKLNKSTPKQNPPKNL